MSSERCLCGHDQADHHIRAFHCWKCSRRSPCLVFRAAPVAPTTAGAGRERP
jgi:hypothetical protein